MASPPREAGSAAGAWWHVVWGLVAAAALAVVWIRGGPPGPEIWALGCGVAAAAAGAALATRGAPGRVVAIILWAVAGAAACHLTGGPAGPFAAWCLAPAAAAAAFGRREVLALGAAGSVGAAGVSALDAVVFRLPQTDPVLAPWLALLALALVVVGFGAGLMGLAQAVERGERRRGRAEQVAEVVARQPLLLASLDSDGRVLFADGAAIVGVAPDRLVGRDLGRLLADAEAPALDAAIRDALRGGSARVALMARDDPEGWLEVSLIGLDRDRLSAVVRDASEQFARERRLEAARLAADQQNAGKSRFLANMSHELRTPLNAIMGFSDIMRQRLFGAMGDRYAEYADLIHESGGHLLELINDVLDMSKIEAERFDLTIERFDAAEATQAVLRLMRGQAERARVDLRGVLPSEALEADADRRALKQIAFNLISNALKFTPAGGAVTVTLQAVGEVLELAVSDTGMGIAQDDLARLGRPFEQAGDAGQRAAGSGLGLSLVRAMARLHGGEMTVESAIGEGTTVTVRLPVLALDADAPPRRSNGAPG